MEIMGMKRSEQELICQQPFSSASLFFITANTVIKQRKYSVVKTAIIKIGKIIYEKRKENKSGSTIII
jgi:hypothetical protein